MVRRTGRRPDAGRLLPQLKTVAADSITTVVELAENTELRAVIQSAVDDANRSVSRAESIREFAVLPDGITIESGELTPTLKVRRAVVETRHANVIQHLYSATSDKRSHHAQVLVPPSTHASR